MSVSENGDERDEDDSVIGRAFMGSAVVFVVIGLVAGISYVILTTKQKSEIVVVEHLTLPDRREMPKVIVPTIAWVDITESAGIHFLHDSGAAGEKLLPETMGSGCAFFDFDADGDQDVLFVNSCAWPDKQDDSKPLSTLAIYANDGYGDFTEVTKTVGLDVSLVGMNRCGRLARAKCLRRTTSAPCTARLG